MKVIVSYTYVWPKEGCPVSGHLVFLRNGEGLKPGDIVPAPFGAAVVTSVSSRRSMTMRFAFFVGSISIAMLAGAVVDSLARVVMAAVASMPY